VTSFRTLVLPLALTAVACDLPTELPRWTTSWEMVAVEKNVRVVDLLPDGVRLDLALLEEHRFAGGVVFLRYAARR